MFGRGVIASVDIVGARKRAQVDFEYTKVWVAFDVLRELPDESAPPSAAEMAVIDAVSMTQTANTNGGPQEDAARPVWTEPALSPLDVSEVEARKGVTALRLGQVPDSQALELSVGTDHIRALLTDALDRAGADRPTFLLVDGAWGGGKTHALTLLAALAGRQRMVIARAVMDGDAVSLSEPKQLMEALVSSLELPGDAAADGLGQLLRSARKVEHLQLLRTRGAPILADALETVPLAAFDNPEALQCIEDYFALSIPKTLATARLRSIGYDMGPLPALFTWQIADQPHKVAELLRNWAQFLSVMGWCGLVIILDELDVEYAATAGADKASTKKKEKRRTLLEELRALDQGRAPLLVALASAPAGADVEKENDAVEDVRAAMGPDLIYFKAADPSDDDLRKLLSRLSDLYERAYPATTLALPGRHVDRLFDGLHQRYRRMAGPVPRHFVRMALEAFDLLAVGGQSMEGVLRLLATSTE